MDTSSKIKKYAPKFFLGLLFFCFTVAGVGGLVMFLWNAILPDLLGLRAISFWQAVGLFILSRILLGGLHFGKRHRGASPFAKSEFRQKFINMSDEEKEAFKNEWKQRCGR